MMKRVPIAAYAAAFALVLGGAAYTAKYSAAADKQTEDNKRVASEFFRDGITPEQRYALLDDGYIQHNPQFKKFADDNKLSYKEGFLKMVGTLRAAGGGPGGANAGPMPPKGNDLYMVLAEKDLVFIMRQQFKQDPTAAPGTFYEAFAWDVFRVKKGKLAEHWDGAQIPPPPAAKP
jgi:predicted SnoaL-like aldol condensation-catalyzing enzyme